MIVSRQSLVNGDSKVFWFSYLMQYLQVDGTVLACERRLMMIVPSVVKVDAIPIMCFFFCFVWFLLFHTLFVGCFFF